MRYKPIRGHLEALHLIGKILSIANDGTRRTVGANLGTPANGISVRTLMGLALLRVGFGCLLSQTLCLACGYGRHRRTSRIVVTMELDAEKVKGGGERQAREDRCRESEGV